jgi:hypothetical protein
VDPVFEHLLDLRDGARTADGTAVLQDFERAYDGMNGADAALQELGYRLRMEGGRPRSSEDAVRAQIAKFEADLIEVDELIGAFQLIQEVDSETSIAELRRMTAVLRKLESDALAEAKRLQSSLLERALLREVSVIGWFRASAHPLSSRWPGPAHASVEGLAVDLQAVKDALPESAQWDACVGLVVAAIGETIPGYSATEDRWHAPTAAAWHAASVLVLNCLLAEHARPIPAIVRDQLAWFSKGYWPAAYTEETLLSADKKYLVL